MKVVYLWFALLAQILLVYGKPTKNSATPNFSLELAAKPISSWDFPTDKTPRPTKTTNNLHTITTEAPAPGRKVNNGKLTNEENKELQNKCGRYTAPHQKSIGSSPSSRAEAPWVVSMALFKEEIDKTGKNVSYTSNFCSGTLISDRQVLTAWHCLASLSEDTMYRPVDDYEDVDMEKMRTIDGVPYVPTNVFQESGISFDKFRFVFDDYCGADDSLAGCSIENAIIRKTVKAISPRLAANYLKQGHMDLAIFELDKPVNFSRDMYPACLSETRPKLEDVLELYSFGSDRQEKNSLTGSIQHIIETSLPCYKQTGIDAICLNSNTQRTAEGDSGGGFIYRKNDRTYVTGVVSGSIEVTDNFSEPHDTAIAHHLHWICNHIGVCVDETKTEQISTFINTITPFI